MSGCWKEGEDQVVCDCYSIAFSRLIVLLGSLFPAVNTLSQAISLYLLLSAPEAPPPPPDVLKAEKKSPSKHLFQLISPL